MELIGNTPMLHIKLNKQYTNIFAKCEMFNPSLSIKDRMVYYIIKAFEQNGTLSKGSTIYEASSGNTGSSLAMIGTALGYTVKLFVPEKTSLEKINTMKLFGAEVIVCPNSNDAYSPQHYINQAQIACDKKPGAVLLNQYATLFNVDTHYNLTATEIWEQMDGKIDYFIAAASTGGTVTGIGKFLKAKSPKIKIILADPVGSIFYNHFYKQPLVPSSYIVEGAGKDKVCSIHDFQYIDDVMQFTDEEAFNYIKICAKNNGLIIGGSSGGILAVADKLRQDATVSGNIVIMFPDSGFKYLSKIN